MSYNNNYGQMPQMQQQNSSQFQQHGYQQNPNMRPVMQQMPGQGYQNQQGQGFQNPQIQQMGYRQMNPDQHRSQIHFTQHPGNLEMSGGNYMRQPGMHQSRMGNPQQIHNVPTVTVSQPHQFQNQMPPGDHNMGQNVNFGGPTSVGQPQSISSNFPNPPSTSHHAPGSVNPPSTGGPLAPGSVGGHNPTSVGQLAPASVGTHGPTSVPQHGPTSVNYPTSVGHGPTSVGPQGPTSVHAGPTSVGPPGSLQTGGPGSVIQEKQQSASSQSIDFGFPQKILDPIAELKMLILKDLRNATSNLNDQVASAIAFVQEQQQISAQGANPHSVANPHSLAANNPSSVNPQSVHNPQSISAPKSIEDSHYRKHKSFSKETYQNAWMQFFAVCDKIEAKATLLIEAQKLQGKFDRMCEYTVPAEIQTRGYPALIQPFLEAMRTDRLKMMETVKLLNDSLQEFRKVTDEGEFLSIAKKGPLSTVFYSRIEKESKNELKGIKDGILKMRNKWSPPPEREKKEKRKSSKKNLTEEERRIRKLKAKNWYYLDDGEESISSSDEDFGDLVADYRAKDYFYPNIPVKRKLPLDEKPNNKNPKLFPEKTITVLPETKFSDNQFQISKNLEIHQMEPAKAEMLGYEEDDQMDEECDPPPPPPIPRPSN